MGLHELYLGESDMVIAGGVDAFNDIFMYMCFAKVTALSTSGDCRPFSDQSDGTMLGEGLSMFALKRLDDAERDGDRIYAVIRGIGTSSDGRAKSIYAPSPAGQAKALRRAYAAAGYGPETVGLVEAHGTGTRAGDAAEFAALREVFDESGRTDRQWCALGSVKSQVGHTKGAAGACGLFKAVMALHHKALPPTIKVDRPNPALEIEQSPFYLSTQAKPWMADNGVPRRASVSSFGFDGTNFHVAVEEYTGTGKRAYRFRSWDSELVVLGAPSAAALSEQAAQLAASLVDTPNMLGWIARSTQAAYNAAQPHRPAVVADSVVSLQAMLNELAAKFSAADVPVSFASPRGYFYSAQRPGPIALLFPGQGSQYVGMGADLPQLHEPALAPWEGARAERLHADRDLHDVVWPKTAFTDDERALQSAELTKTEWAQPGIGAHSLSLLTVIRALGIAPVAVGGHSFGEVTALCAAGVLSGDVALQIARKRGELMAEAATNSDGAMCPVTAPVEQVRQLIGEWGLPVVIANHNAPNQAVLSGNSTAIDHAAQRFAAAGINARRLDVATAFHSDIVSPAAVPFGFFLAGVAFGMPEVPVYANATAQPYAGDAQQMRTTLANQIAQPVRFVEQIQAMWRAGARTFIEVGPGGVLTNLVGKCLAGEEHTAVSLDAKGKNGIRSLWIGLAQLVAAGVPMNFEGLWADYRVGDDPRNRQQPKLTLKINGSNYGRPPISDEPVRRPSDIETTLDHRGRSNGHRTESESNFMPSEPITPVIHVNGTAAPVDPPASLPVVPTILPPPAAAVLNGHAASNGKGHGAHPSATAVLAAPAAVTLAAPPPVAAPGVAPVLSAEAVTEMISAVGTLRDGFDRLQWVLQALVVPPATASPAPAPAALNGTAAAAPAPVAVAASVAVAPNGTAPASVAAASAPAATALAAPVALASNGIASVSSVSADLVSQVLGVVADKTGYPVEMLDLSMALEADLGIDSIKRVEILSAVQERVPSLPEVETAAMAALGTLQEIVDYLQSLMAPAAHNGAPPMHAPPPVPAISNGAVAGDRLPFELAGAAIARHAVRAIAAPASGMAMPGLYSAANVEIVTTSPGVGEALAANLRTHGIGATTVAEPSAGAEAVIHLGGLQQTTTRADTLALNRTVFAHAHSAAARFEERGGVFVTVQDTGGTFGLLTEPGSRAWAAGIGALAKTAAQEWPKAQVKAIDIAAQRLAPTAVAEHIAHEILAGGAELEVGLGSTHGRVTVVADATPVAAHTRRIDQRDVIVVSGGARGVTAASVIALAEQTQASFVLIGRTALGDEPPAVRGLTTDAELKRALLTSAAAQGLKLTPKQLEQQVRGIWPTAKCAPPSRHWPRPDPGSATPRPTFGMPSNCARCSIACVPTSGPSPGWSTEPVSWPMRPCTRRPWRDTTASSRQKSGVWLHSSMRRPPKS